jgi:hypothetical protein
VNNVAHHVLRLLAIDAFAIGVPKLASASEVENSTPFRIAMGPMSPAQKNQGSPAKLDNVVARAGSSHHT